MIIEEIIGKWIDGKTDLVSRKTDSEETYLHKVGTTEFYDEAVDLATSSFTYEEVSKPITSAPAEEEGEESPTQEGEI